MAHLIFFLKGIIYKDEGVGRQGWCPTSDWGQLMVNGHQPEGQMGGDCKEKAIQRRASQTPCGKGSGVALSF